MKSFKCFLMGAAVLLALTACNKESKTDEQQDEAYYAANAYITSGDSNFTSTDNGGTIAFKAAGGSVTVVVACGCDWTVLNNASDQVTAEANATAGTLVLTAPQNTKEEEKTTTITLLTSNLRIQFATIIVTQNAYGAPEITVETNEWNAPAKGALSTEIGVDSSLGTWTVENDADWLTVTNTDNSVILTAAENKEAEERSVRITLTADDGYRSDYETIRINQDARANIDLSSDSVTLYDKGESVNVTVDANFDWDYSYDNTNGFFTISRDGDKLTVVITADNETSDDLSGIVTITAGDGAENTAEVCLTVKLASPQPDALILDFDIPSAGLRKVTLPLVGSVDCTVNWGDGVEETVKTELPTHTYSETGSYVVRVNGTVSGLSFQDVNTLSSANTTLTAVEQWGHTGLKTMDYAFYLCTNLSSVPADLDGSFANVITFAYAFYYTDIKSVPEDLFKYATKVTDFLYTFAHSSLASVPENLFASCTEVTDFKAVLRQCNVSSIPAGLFANNTKAEKFTQALYGLPITTLPEHLFDNCPDVTTFEEMLETCSYLSSIPEDIFRYNTKVTSFYALLFGTALTTVPEGLFKYNTEVTSFRYLFGDSDITTVPLGLFANNTKATNFGQAFKDCSNLKSLPEGGLFANTAATSFQWTFYGAGLESIPKDLFAGCNKVEDFTWCFMDDSTIEGESPYDEIEVNGNTVKVHLYERKNYPDLYTTPDGSKCYDGCTKLSDYSAISSAGWN